MEEDVDMNKASCVSEDQRVLSPPPSLGRLSRAPSPWLNTKHTASYTNTTTFKCMATVSKPTQQIHSLALSQTILYATTHTNKVVSWHHPELTDHSTFRAGNTRVNLVVALGELLFTVNESSKIRVWRRSVSKPDVHRVAAILPHNRLLLGAIGVGGSRKDMHLEPVTCMAYHGLDNLVFTASSDNTVKVWWMKDGRCLSTLRGHTGSVNSVSVREDGVLFTGSDDGTVKVWKRTYNNDMSSTSTLSSSCRCAAYKYELCKTLLAMQSPVRALAVMSCVQPERVWAVFAGCSDGYIHEWDEEKTSRKSTLSYVGCWRGHSHAVLCMSVAEVVVVSGSADKCVRVWSRDESGLTCIAVLTGHQGPVMSVATALDAVNSRIIVYSGGLDGAIRMWLGSDERHIAERYE